MKTTTYKMSIDLEELYLAALIRKCSIKVCSSDVRGFNIEIIEDNGTSYKVILRKNDAWLKYKIRECVRRPND